MRRRTSVGRSLSARRPIVVQLSAGVLLALTLLVVGVPLSRQPSSAQASGGGPAIGLSVPTLVNESSSQQAASLATMRSIGVRWVRVDANWSWVQPTGPSSFDWSLIDREVDSMTAAGMHVDLIIDDTPPWARNSDAPGNWGQPASASAFATYAREVAERYVPKGVLTYEIWNEPNIQTFWTPAPNPTLYTAMLRDSYSAIKAAEPKATVLSGGLAPATDDGTNIAPITFLGDMYADGAKGSFDALGYHAYSAPTLPDTYNPGSGWSQMDQTNPSLRSVMTANGDAGKQIWITEVGAPSSGPIGVGTTAQAEEVTQAVQGAQGTSWIGAEFFYTYQDATTNPDYYGLRNADGSPKPAWAALAAALSQGSSTPSSVSSSVPSSVPSSIPSSAPPPTNSSGTPFPLAWVVVGAALLVLGGVGYAIARIRITRRRRRASKSRGRHRRTSPYRRWRHKRRERVRPPQRVSS
jgi:polysaccharide biosynthesis protein PslG